MKLVDEKLKKIFEKEGIDNFIEAYGYLKNSGCYSRLECMSNSLYYYPEVNINDYDLIILYDNDTEKKEIVLYKLIDAEHMKGYIEFSFSNENYSEIHEELYTKIITIDELHINDVQFITKGYENLMLRRNRNVIDSENESRFAPDMNGGPIEPGIDDEEGGEEDEEIEWNPEPTGIAPSTVERLLEAERNARYRLEAERHEQMRNQINSVRHMPHIATTLEDEIARRARLTRQQVDNLDYQQLNRIRESVGL